MDSCETASRDCSKESQGSSGISRTLRRGSKNGQTGLACTSECSPPCAGKRKWQEEASRNPSTGREDRNATM
eukprot:11801119-Heterocapsa_arctica.AAC.1